MLHNKENNKLTDLSLQKCKALKQCEDIKLITFENNEFSGYLREANRQVGQILFLSFFLFFFFPLVSWLKQNWDCLLFFTCIVSAVSSSLNSLGGGGRRYKHMAAPSEHKLIPHSSYSLGNLKNPKQMLFL